MAIKRKLKLLFDCNVCPAYCCSYPEIGVTRSDMVRIASRYGITIEAAIKRFCKVNDEGKIQLRHKSDPIFNTACRFLDRNTRKCTIYEHRPKVCRSFPEERRCGYYDFLMWERKRQDDSECVP